MYSKYLKENETTILVDSKPETSETVILTEQRVVYIKGDKVRFDEEYETLKKLIFKDKANVTTLDPNETCSIKIGAYIGDDEGNICSLAEYPKIREIAAELQKKCTNQRVTGWACKAARKMYILGILAPLAGLLLFGIFAVALGVFIGIAFVPVGIVSCIVLIKKAAKKEENYRRRKFAKTL